MPSDDTSKITREMRKGILEFLILSIIGRGEAYASDILNTLKMSELIVVEGTLYPLLSRLKAGGLISYHWIESPSGPPRKYYRLTSAGQDARTLMATVWSELSTAATHILKKRSSPL